MRKRVEQLLNGKVSYQNLRLQVSEERIYAAAKKEESFQNTLTLQSPDGRKIRGYVTTDHRRILVDKNYFCGEKPRISYGIDLMGLSAGEKVEGTICFCSSIGEKKIPVLVEVEPEQMKSSVGQIASLEDFGRLARENFREAFQLFKNPEAFARVLQKEDAKAQALYKGLCQNPIGYQNLEEYCIGAGLKNPIRFQLRGESADFSELKASTRETLEIQRSGWGYVELQVEVRGEFLKVSKFQLQEEDFIGSICQFPYLIQEEKLGNGKNHGEIRFKNAYQELIYHITVRKGEKIQVRKDLVEKQFRLAFTEDYLEFRVGKITGREWKERTHSLLRQLKNMGQPQEAFRLYEAYVLYEEKKKKEALEILLGFREQEMAEADLEILAAYLYLCYLLGAREDQEQTARRLRSFYVQKEESFWLFWFWISLQKEFQESLSKKLFMMEEQYMKGCRSPLLYLEAYEIIAQNPNLLRRISPFWVQVLHFAALREVLNADICERLIYLFGYEKTYSEILYQVLEHAYRKFPSKELLEVICKYIIKGIPGQTRYFPWFSEAIEQKIRINRVYEYYMETLDLSVRRMLPRTLLHYFAYSSASLSEDRRAYLYAGVVLTKEQDAQMYQEYLRAMREFTFRMLKKGRMDENYAVLYQEFALNPISREEARETAKLLFTYRLYCDDPKIHHVIVRHSQMQKEEVVPCVRGVAYIRSYTGDGAILFRDSRQRRYYGTVNYNLKRLMDEKNAAKKCLRLGVVEPGLLLYECQNRAISKDSLDFYEILADMEEFSEEYRGEIRRKLLEYYDTHLEELSVQEHLGEMKYENFIQIDKTKLIEMLIRSERYLQAYDLIEQYGCEGLKPEQLLKLTRALICLSDKKEEEGVLALACQCFVCGAEDAVLFNYLIQKKEGPADFLIVLWKKCMRSRLNVRALEEKILQLLMLTWDFRREGGYIFEHYAPTGEEELVRAYLLFACYAEFCQNIHHGEFLEKKLEQMLREKEPMDFLCKLTYLKRLSEKERLPESKKAVARDILRSCEVRGLQFAFFQKLPSDIRETFQIEDKCYLEYHGNAEDQVTLYYQLNSGIGSGEAEEWKSEPVQEMYRGYFSRIFTLFYGETLRYYFRVESAGETKQTEIQEISVEKLEKRGHSKFQILNRAIQQYKAGRTEETAQLLKEYLRQEQYLKHIFTIEKES